jgi:hypothetical protein
MCVHVCVIHLQVTFAVLVHVVFFQCLSVFLFCVLIMPTVPVMVPYLCPVFNMCLSILSYYIPLLLMMVSQAKTCSVI